MHLYSIEFLSSKAVITYAHKALIPWSLRILQTIHSLFFFKQILFVCVPDGLLSKQIDATGPTNLHNTCWIKGWKAVSID